MDFGIADVTSSQQALLERFSSSYQNVHGYLSLAVCSFGIVSNALNIAVLSHRSMSTATNCLLTALAITDLLTMLVYVPYAGYFYCYSHPDPAYHHRYVWIVYLLFNSAFGITAHTIAVWLTVSIAVFRYIVICGNHSLSARLCNHHRARIAVGAVVSTTVVFCLPNYVMYSPLAIHASAEHRSTTSPIVRQLDESFWKRSNSSFHYNHDDTRDETASGNNCSTSSSINSAPFWFQENSFVTERYRIINFWLFGVVLKVFPCLLLTVLSGLLVRAMRLANHRRRRLLNAGRRSESDCAGERNRTTAMLVAVVLCFVATEMPQGVLAFLSGVDKRIFAAVYVPLGDFWDILVLVNSAVNFIVYCKMNRRFRRTVVDGFCKITASAGLRVLHNGVATSPEAPTAGTAMISSRPTARTQHASV